MHVRHPTVSNNFWFNPESPDSNSIFSKSPESKLVERKSHHLDDEELDDDQKSLISYKKDLDQNDDQIINKSSLIENPKDLDLD